MGLGQILWNPYSAILAKIAFSATLWHPRSVIFQNHDEFCGFS
jgi:hypothetical protein